MNGLVCLFERKGKIIRTGVEDGFAVLNSTSPLHWCEYIWWSLRINIFLSAQIEVCSEKFNISPTSKVELGLD